MHVRKAAEFCFARFTFVLSRLRHGSQMQHAGLGQTQTPVQRWDYNCIRYGYNNAGLTHSPLQEEVEGDRDIPTTVRVIRFGQIFVN